MPTEPRRYIPACNYPTGASYTPPGEGCRMVRVTQEDPWAKIPHWVVTSPELDASAIRVYLVLSKHANNRTHDSFPGMRRIAEEAHLLTTTVQRAIAQLEAAGAVEVSRTNHAGRRAVNRYHLPFTRVPESDTPLVPQLTHGVPISDTPPGPITDTELEGSLTRTSELDDLLRIQDQNPRLPGESRAAWLHRINHQSP